MRAADDNANLSAVSNSACATTPGIPPATITDLRMTSVTSSSVTLEWTAPGADGDTGQAAAYELVRLSERINTITWSDATPISGLPSPAVAGAAESFTVTGLDGATSYVFAVRATDGAGNTGAISNNASATTDDDVPPSGVTDLLAETDSSADGALLLSWTAPGDNGLVGQVDAYDVRLSRTPITASNFDAAQPFPGPSPVSPGDPQSLSLTGLLPETLYYAAMKAIDDMGNTSALSNIASAWTRDMAPGSVSDLAVTGSTGSSAGGATVSLAWTAPGDDGHTGTAASYDLRYSTSPMNAYNFGSAVQAVGEPAPLQAGTAQAFTVDGLSLGAAYYFALVTIDDRGNTSSISNVVGATTADSVPPAAVSDLAATTGSTQGTLASPGPRPATTGSRGTSTDTPCATPTPPSTSPTSTLPPPPRGSPPEVPAASP